MVRRPVWFTEPMLDLPHDHPFTIDFSTGFYFHDEGKGLLFGMPRFFYATGFSGHGFLLGPAVGEVIRFSAAADNRPEHNVI